MAKIDKFTMNDLKFPTKETRDKLNQLVECVNGKADNVCEWKYPSLLFEDGNEVFEVECNKNPLKHKSIPNNFSFTDFKYCPYCGRKIKVIKDGRD